MEKLTTRQCLMNFAHVLQTALFPVIAEETGPLSVQAKLLMQVLAMAPLGPWLSPTRGPGRPPEDRMALASAFVAKAVYGCTTTRQLLSYLNADAQLRRLCGWTHASAVPHESTFSRAFAEFAASELPQKLHQALIQTTQSERLIGHISRDSTAIEARERFPEKEPQQPRAKPEEKKAKKSKPKQKSKSARRPKKAKAADRGTLMERQRYMKLSQMLETLPTACAIGVKTSSKGQQQYWRGYKLHADVADGQIPVSLILTGANVHDSTAAIPLMTMSAQRVTSCYDLMDSAYDADAILSYSRQLGHVPIVQPHPRRNGRSKSQLPKVFAAKKAPELSWAQQDRFRERTAVERVFARLKDEFGADKVRVRGASKVMAHLMFGVLALTVDQLLRLTG
jgi:Transposase DDE domain/Transposase domain (DUF772)